MTDRSSTAVALLTAGRYGAPMAHTTADRIGLGLVGFLFGGLYVLLTGYPIFDANALFSAWDCGASDCDTWGMTNMMLLALFAGLGGVVSGAAVALASGPARLLWMTGGFCVGAPALLWLYAATATPPGT
jgi:hypothetical protein